MALTRDVDAIMKGALHTDELMHCVVDADSGLRTERRVSHVFLIDAPHDPRLLFITDAAVNIYPSPEDKRDIVQNAIDLAHALRVRTPRVAILSAVELVTPKIKSTLDAAVLRKMSDRGQITGAILDGSLAFDNAVSRAAAATKAIASGVAGRADIFVVPDLKPATCSPSNWSISPRRSSPASCSARACRSCSPAAPMTPARVSPRARSQPCTRDRQPRRHPNRT